MGQTCKQEARGDLWYRGSKRLQQPIKMMDDTLIVSQLGHLGKCAMHFSKTARKLPKQTGSWPKNDTMRHEQTLDGKTDMTCQERAKNRKIKNKLKINKQ